MRLINKLWLSVNLLHERMASMLRWTTTVHDLTLCWFRRTLVKLIKLLLKLVACPFFDSAWHGGFRRLTSSGFRVSDDYAPGRCQSHHRDAFWACPNEHCVVRTSTHQICVCHRRSTVCCRDCAQTIITALVWLSREEYTSLEFVEDQAKVIALSSLNLGLLLRPLWRFVILIVLKLPKCSSQPATIYHCTFLS